MAQRKPAVRHRSKSAGQSTTKPRKMKMTTEIPPQITTPDSVETRIGTLKFFDGFPDDATTQKAYDNIDFQRGVEAFLAAMPGASVYALREGFKSQGADNQTVLIMETLMDSKSLFLTPNSETVYNIMWLDLKEGPLVLETPPNILGVLDDHWFKYVGGGTLRHRAESQCCRKPSAWWYRQGNRRKTSRCRCVSRRNPAS